jgi:hypothetical protein
MGMGQQQNEDVKGKIDEKCDPALLCLPCVYMKLLGTEPKALG